MLFLRAADSSLARVSSSSSSDDKDPVNWKRVALVAGGTFFVAAGIVLTYAGAKTCWPKVTAFTSNTYNSIYKTRTAEQPTPPPAPPTAEQIAQRRARNKDILNKMDKVINSREMQALEKMNGGQALVLAMVVGLLAAAILLLPLIVVGLGLSIAYTAPVLPGLSLIGTGGYLIHQGIAGFIEKA